MKPGSSQVWRAQGDHIAFDPGQWEFQSRLQYQAAVRLRQVFTDSGNPPTAEAIACLVVAQFNLSLAVELVAKAYYLQAKLGQPEEIYTHVVSAFVPPQLVNKEQGELLAFAAQCVEWSGRYPTPKWTKESSREKYDLPQGPNANTIDATHIPNRASLEIVNSLDALYLHLHDAWRKHVV
jgi:hypothetical protein